MQHYDDQTNQKGLTTIFFVAQVIVLLIVDLFVYSTYLAVGHAVEKYGVSIIMYLPVYVALVLFPVLLYRYGQMFKQGKMLVATTWMMGTASFTIVALYAYIAQIAG